MFLGYWNNPEATAAKFAGDWLLTGDVALQDGDGYIWYKGREDDLISSGGYRIGPTDIEDCLVKHEAVLMAAAVGLPRPGPRRDRPRVYRAEAGCRGRSGPRRRDPRLCRPAPRLVPGAARDRPSSTSCR